MFNNYITLVELGEQMVLNFNEWRIIIMAFAYLGIVLGSIKGILEVVFYMSAIFVSFKALQALNIYINKNSK